MSNILNNLFFVDVVECSKEYLKLKIGLTEELCNKSKILSIRKKFPLTTSEDFSWAMHTYEHIVVESLRNNNFKNFGDDDNPTKPGVIRRHQFVRHRPKIPTVEF